MREEQHCHDVLRFDQTYIAFLTFFVLKLFMCADRVGPLYIAVRFFYYHVPNLKNHNLTIHELE